MIKIIKVEDLTIGMFIHDFNCSWLDHPFYTNSLKITDETMLHKVFNAGIREVFIDTDKGLDSATTEGSRTKPAQPKEAARPKKKKDVTVGAEINRAIEIKKEARQTITNMMEDVKSGEAINPDQAENVVENIITSAFRNQDALISLLRIKQADEYTYLHSISSCVLLVSFCKYLGLDQKLIKDVAIGGLLHDVGKMKIPDEIISKPGKLSETEYELIKKHVEYGLEIIGDTPGISQISRDIISQHHERIDGTGYPKGLKGNENSKFGQMAAIVDIYDAMTSQRCYRDKLQPTAVLSKLYDWGKAHFDNELVKQFIQCVGIYPVGTLIRLKNGFLAVVINRGNKNMLLPIIRIIYNTKRDHFIMPFDLDLSKKAGTDSNYKIMSYESPEKWNINTASHL